MPFVLDSFARLKAEADIVLVEGAGSASEVNLRANDIANMGFARAADVPVVLIGDIDRGGVIASLVGTKAVIDARRRGADPRLSRQQVSRRSGAVRRRHGDDRARNRMGGARPRSVLPRRAAAAGRGCAGARWRAAGEAAARVRIAVPILPHIANFDDLDPLDAEPAVDLVRVRPGSALPGDADLVILPGSKATIADLAALRQAGFDIDIAAHLRRGGTVLGLCGGYQMLGRIDRRSGRHRGAARRGGRPRPARYRDRALRRKAARAGARRDRATASRSRATRCIWA